MATKRICALALIALTSVAQADDLSSPAPPSPPDYYVALGFEFAAESPVPAFIASLNPRLELGRRIRGVFWAHADISGWQHTAGSSWFDNSYQRIAVAGGVEARPCTRGGRVCLLAGIDLVFLDANGDAAPYEFEGVLGRERLGIDVGGRHVRFRVAGMFEHYLTPAEAAAVNSKDDHSTADAIVAGGGLDASLGITW